MNVPFTAYDAQELMREAHERGPREFSSGCLDLLLDGCLAGIQAAADCGLPGYTLHTPFSADGDCEIQTEISQRLRSANFVAIPSVYTAGQHRLLKFSIQWASE